MPITGGSGTGAATSPGGSDTQPQYNNAGAFGGMAGITWVPGTSTYTFGGGVVVNFAGATSGNAQLKAPAVAGAAVITLPGVTSALATLGGNTFTSAQAVPSGSAGSASIRFGSDTSGFYSVASGTVSFSASGTPVVLFSANTGIATWIKSLRLSSTTLMAWSGGNPDATADDTAIGRRSAGSLFFGVGDTATPVAYTLAGNSSRAGTDSNVAGAPLTIHPGIGTGNATPGALIFKSMVAVASGTGAQTATTTLTLNGGVATFAGNVTVSANGLTTTPGPVSTLPTASAYSGTRCYVNDATMTILTGNGTTVAGGGANVVPVGSNGTNWLIGG